MPRNYWTKRQIETESKLTTKSIKDTEEQLQKYYKNVTLRIMSQFEATYDKLQATIAEGRTPTPADLYKLDKYWKLQADLQKELHKLGDKQIDFLTQQFIKEYSQIYEAMALEGDLNFSKASYETAQQMIQQIWCADGKSWSQRVWSNVDKLQEALNENLIDCVLTGKKTTELKKLLMNQFNVSYHRADSIIRTEMAHIETEAAKQRYSDYGIEEVEVLIEQNACKKCQELRNKRFPINGKMPVPMHTNCRCCIVPVIPVGE